MGGGPIPQEDREIAMDLSTRKVINGSLSGVGYFAILIMALALIILLAPILSRGMGAIFFRETVEHRRMLLEQFEKGDEKAVKAEVAEVRKARQPVYDMLAAYETHYQGLTPTERRKLKTQYQELRKALTDLFGPIPGTEEPQLLRYKYGQTRWDRAQYKLQKALFVEEWDYSDAEAMGRKVLVPRVGRFAGTPAEPIFGYLEKNLDAMLRPKFTVYTGFLTDHSVDSHVFGGIWPEILGTLYLTIGAMIFAIPMGVIAAIYLCEYAKENHLLRLLRSCISTLAGVPSIVFGLFGLAFFINTVHVSESKSVIAGSMTLALMILPTIIRASEEAIRAVPRTYKEAALSLGGGKWQTIMKVVLPASLPGILTGIVISMGRAAGETAPIIFTAAVSVGLPPVIGKIAEQPTPALPWNIYNISTEHEAVDEIRHVQFGMVMVLVLLVLALNLFAILLRARIAKKLRG